MLVKFFVVHLLAPGGFTPLSSGPSSPPPPPLNPARRGFFPVVVLTIYKVVCVIDICVVSS